MRPFILHAHFYQPERLNPWTGALDPEPSAAPDRDWNERIWRESYRPNGSARIFDHRRRVEHIVNNYERLSFNFGPTLLSWLERAHPRSYAKVLAGDFRGTVRTGHGNAIAQAYNHMILPLANARDRRTQIRWGKADFRHRFKREPEGMWLPEAGIDQATVDALIDEGVGHTVLAPQQAARVQDAEGVWRDAAETLDTSRAYRLRHSDGSGRAIAVLFYDGNLAQSLAFDPATADAAVLVERLAGAGGDGLVHAALDGETFGHHHQFGELGLAYALFTLAEQRGLEPTNYGAYLAAHPPERDAQIVDGEGSSWSCAHGVGRWYRDCGCATDALPGWRQAWRTPLRQALDLVRDTAADVFDEHGGKLLRDPWSARDDAIHVRLGQWTPGTFLERHARPGLDDQQRVDLWTLLEAQRHAMVMYTSCGWFFGDVSGIETVYVLRSAARVMNLLEELGHRTPRAEVTEILAEARSNKPEAGSGADVWRDQVEPAAVTPTRVAAHVALSALVRPWQAAEEVAGHDVELADLRAEQRGRMGLATAHVTVTSVSTRRRHELAVAAVHLGGLDFHGVVTPYPGDAVFTEEVEALWREFPTAPLAGLIKMLGDLFETPDAPFTEFGLEQALPEGRQEVVGAVFGELAQRFRDAYARLYLDYRRILEMLVGAGYELPRDLRAAAELTLSAELEARIGDETSQAGPDRGMETFTAVRELLALARSQGYHLDLSRLEQVLARRVEYAAAEAARELTPDTVRRLERWLDLCAELGVDVDLFEAQEHAYEAATRARSGRLGLVEREQAERLGLRLGLSPVAWGARPD